MGQKRVRIELYIRRPDKFITLCTRIEQKHVEEGANSPLMEFDMAVFIVLLNTTGLLRSVAKGLHEEGQSLFNKARVAAGFGKGQNITTPGTLYNIVREVRDRLKISYKTNLEALSQWGFDVVLTQTGSRLNVRIKIPRKNIGNLLDLADSIVTKHTADGGSSPLNSLDMPTFDTLRTDIRTDHNAAIQKHGEAESKNNQAEVNFGWADGQSSQTVGTLYFNVLQFRDKLLLVNSQNEEALTTWGFKVVIGTIRKGKKNPNVANALFTLRENDTGQAVIPNVLIFDQNSGQALGTTDVNGQFTESGLPKGIRSFEYTLDTYQTKVTVENLVKGDNMIEVLMDKV